MKLQLIHTENYLVAVDDSKIEGGNKSLLILEGFQDGEPMILSHWQGVEDGYLGKKITHHLPLNNAPILEGIELLPPLENDSDVFIIAETMVKEHPDFVAEGYSDYQNGRFNGIIDGYNKAKEKYNFTEEDMVEFATFRNGGDVREEFKLWKEQQPKLPTSFDTETKQYIY